MSENKNENIKNISPSTPLSSNKMELKKPTSTRNQPFSKEEIAQESKDKNKIPLGSYSNENKHLDSSEITEKKEFTLEESSFATKNKNSLISLESIADEEPQSDERPQKQREITEADNRIQIDTEVIEVKKEKKKDKCRDYLNKETIIRIVLLIIVSILLFIFIYWRITA